MNAFTTLSLFSEEVSASYSMSEKLTNILQTAVLGFAVVFLVLAIIWGILEIFGVIFGGKKKPEKETPVPVFTEEPEEDAGETVAAIAAAISAYSGKPVSSFRVVSFRKSSR